MSGKLPGTDGKPTFLPTGPKLHTLIPAVGGTAESYKTDEYRDGPTPSRTPPIKIGNHEPIR